MNKLIKEQLEKVNEASIPYYDEQTKEIFIPKLKKDKYVVGENCIIELDDSLLIKGANEILESNRNRSTLPPNKYLIVDVLKVMNKMINVHALPYNISTKEIINNIWNGWLPISLIAKINE